MKKTIATAALAALVGGGAAHADDHTFPTAVLDAGQADGGLAGTWHRSEMTDSVFGRFTSEATVASAFARVGLGGGFDLGAAVPYLIHGKGCAKTGSGASYCAKADPEWGDVAVLGEYRLVGRPHEPFSASLSVLYNTNSAGQDFQYYDFELATGFGVSDDVQIYANVDRNQFEDADRGGAWALSLGMFAGVTDSFTLEPELTAARTDPQAPFDAYFSYGAALTGHFALADDVYLLPYVAYHYAKLPDAPYSYSASDDRYTVLVGALTLYVSFGDAPAPRPAPPRPAPAANSTIEPSAAPPAAATAPALTAATVAPGAGTAREPSAAVTTRVAGEIVTLSQATTLLARPRTDGQSRAAVEAGASVRLKARVQNEGGAFWYVESGSAAGWVPESELR